MSSLRAQLVALKQMLDDGLLSEPEWNSAREKALTDFHGLSRAAAELRQQGDWVQKGPEERGLEPDPTPTPHLGGCVLDSLALGPAIVLFVACTLVIGVTGTRLAGVFAKIERGAVPTHEE